MNIEPPDPMTDRDADRAPQPDALRAALAGLRRDVAPARELWPEIATRIADADERERIALPPALAAELKTLRQDAAAPPALWASIAARIGAAEAREADAPAPTPALQQQLVSLRREVAPGRDLWAGIAARTVERPMARSRRGLRPRIAAFAVAASLVAAVGLVVQVERPLDRAPAATAGSGKAPLRPSAEAYVATIAEPRRADPEQLRASYRPISDEARVLMKANLAIVDSAEAQIEQAMADDPDSAAELQALLDSARAQRAQLRAALESRP